jgi:hypothetical protein
VGTLSIIPDIGIIWPAEFSSSGLAAARFARTARAVRLFRIFRVIRVVRLLRVFHLLQALNRLIFHQSMANKLEAGDEDDALATALGQKHAESIERRVVFIVLLIMFVSPFLEAPVYDLSRAQGLLSVQATNNMMEEAKGWYVAGSSGTRSGPTQPILMLMLVLAYAHRTRTARAPHRTCANMNSPPPSRSYLGSPATRP